MLLVRRSGVPQIPLIFQALDPLVTTGGASRRTRLPTSPNGRAVKTRRGCLRQVAPLLTTGLIAIYLGCLVPSRAIAGPTDAMRQATAQVSDRPPQATPVLPPLS